jgi:hypothetical protein
MITTILIVLVAVVVLIVIIALAALRFLRADDSDTLDELPGESRAARRTPAEPELELVPAGAGRAVSRPSPPSQQRPVGRGPRPVPADVRGAPGHPAARTRGPREPDIQSRPGLARRPGTGSGPQQVVASAGPPARPKRPADVDARTSSWDSLSDVDYWAELKNDKSLDEVTTNGSGPATASRRTADPRADAPRPAEPRQARPDSGALPVRQRSNGRTAPSPVMRSADPGLTEQIDMRAARPASRYPSDQAIEATAALARLGDQQAPGRRGAPQSSTGPHSSPGLVPGSGQFSNGQRANDQRSNGQRPAASAQRPAPGQRPVPAGERQAAAGQRLAGTGQRPATGPRPAQPPLPAPAAAQAPRPSQSSRPGRSSRPSQAARPGAVLQPNQVPYSNGHSQPLPLDNDPLTSPSFPAINASDSRSYRPRRGGSHSGAHSQPGGYPVQPAASMPTPAPAPPAPASPAPVAPTSIPAANPYGSFVSAPDPSYPQRPASQLDAAGYNSGFAAGQQAIAGGDWYNNLAPDASHAANGYLPAPMPGTNGSGTNGSGGRHGYPPIDYSNLTYSDSAYPDRQPGAHRQTTNGYGHAGPHEQRGYPADAAYGQDGHQGYPGYGNGR